MSAKLSKLTDVELSDRLAAKSVELDAIRARYQALQSELNKVYDEEQALQAEIDGRLVKAGPTWEWLLEETGYASSKRYKACQAALNKLGLRSDTYNPAINQRIVTVCIRKNSKKDVRRAFEALTELLPHIKLMLSDDEPPQVYAYINVLEKTLSEHGVYYLAINETIGLYELRCERYRSSSTVKRADGLLELLTYLSVNCYYNGYGDDSEED